MKSNVTSPVIGRTYLVEARVLPGEATHIVVATMKRFDQDRLWVFEWLGSELFHDPARPNKFSCVAVTEIPDAPPGVTPPAAVVSAQTFKLTLQLTPCSDAEINCMFCLDPQPTWESTYRARGSQRVTVGLCEACRANVKPIQRDAP